jgi:hypothetical protein
MQTNEDTRREGAPADPPAQRGGAAPTAAGANDEVRARRKESLLPAFAVGLVAVAALTAALMSARPNSAEPAAAVQADAGGPVSAKDVVRAPPLKPPAGSASAEGKPPATQAMGAGAACADCGVVQMVVAVHGHAQPRASGYQMHIRMDDGTTRTVEQRGALAAGSRVRVDGDSVRLLAQRPEQG